MEKEKPLPAPPPNPPTERKRPHDISLTEPVILSPPSSTTEHENHRLIRLEFYTRTQGKDQRNTTNNEPLQTLIKNALTHVYKTVPSFEVHPLEDWPKRYTTVSSTVKTAPGSEKHSSNHNEKITDKTKKSHQHHARRTSYRPYRSRQVFPLHIGGTPSRRTKEESCPRVHQHQ